MLWRNLTADSHLKLQKSSNEPSINVGLTMEILMEPSFLYDRGRSTWAWHKSWILPEMVVKLIIPSLATEDLTNRNCIL
jgi:hypothetical protein